MCLGSEGWASCIGWTKLAPHLECGLVLVGVVSHIPGNAGAPQGKEHSWLWGFFRSLGYFHKGVTPGLKENSTLGQLDISALDQPPSWLCVVLKLLGFAPGHPLIGHLMFLHLSILVCLMGLRGTHVELSVMMHPHA